MNKKFSARNFFSPRFSFCLALSVFCFLLLPSCQTPGSPSATDSGPKRSSFWAIYVLATNLESEGAEATRDLQEIVGAYHSLSATERERIHMLVGFGGSDIEGWRGIRYADLPCLAKDAEDEKFGNGECYTYTNPQANLGKSETLKHFLDFSQQQAPQAKIRLMSFWNHGAAFLGVGPDTAHPFDFLELKEMQQAFDQSQARFDVLGFDACLMANLAVAAHLSPYADYLLASEELEPGHGWAYTPVVAALGRGLPDAMTFGKITIDAFLDHPSHQKSKLKTLSLLNLKSFDALQNELASFSQLLQSATLKQPVLSAAARSEPYGKSQANGDEFTLDAQGFVTQLVENLPAVAPQARALQQRLKDFVVYHRQDGSRPGAQGVSIFSPRNHTLFQQKRYNLNNAVNAEYFKLLQSIHLFGDDKELPLVKLLKESEDKTQFYALSDNVGISRVRRVLVNRLPNEADYEVLGSDPVGSHDINRVALRPWDGGLFSLCLSACQTDKPELLHIPSFFESEISTGRLYSSDALLNGHEVILYLLSDQSGRVQEAFTVPFESGDSGVPLIQRAQRPLQQGDRLSIYRELWDGQSDSELALEEEALLQVPPEFGVLELVDGESFYFLEVEDLAGNVARSELLPAVAK